MGKGPKEKRVNLFGFQPLFSCSDPPGITAKNKAQGGKKKDRQGDRNFVDFNICNRNGKK
ncbi:MAG: hypothetical protein CL941_00515 [Desulfobacter sp.]|nr:hypothetical protein [Desulfobacter sp.]